jgi:DNA polymerase III alpha subunit
MENHWLFHIESPAMRGLLRRLKCNYKTLVASSIIRPGVAQSGMMKNTSSAQPSDRFEYFHDVF